MNTNSKFARTVIAQYMATGRVAFYYPRRGSISVDGVEKPLDLAIHKMQEVIKRENDGH